MSQQTKKMTQINGTTMLFSRKARIIMIIVLVVLSSLFSSVIRTPTAYAKYCGTASANHCYGTQDWYGGAGNMVGAKTDIAVATNMNCSNTCSFIDNEMWVNDQTCPNQYGSCWIEAGYIDDPGYFPCGYCYFWADIRPVDGNALNWHVAPGGFYSPTTFSIYKNGTNRFEVDLTYRGNCQFNCTDTYFSTNNSMVPDDINIGQELAAGNSGDASAPRVDYTNNYWRGKNNTWNHQTGWGNGPGISAANPPYAAWVNNNPSSNDFYTHCC